VNTVCDHRRGEKASGDQEQADERHPGGVADLMDDHAEVASTRLLRVEVAAAGGDGASQLAAGHLGDVAPDGQGSRGSR
jgi:hypothetical protein